MTIAHDEVDVAVVGAGLAGLEAAHRLHAAGARVVVLEARDRVGGRTWSRPLGKSVFDYGGQWLGPTQVRVAALTRRLGITTFPTWDRGRKILDQDGVLSTYKGTIPKLPLLSLLDLHFALRKLDQLAARIPLDDPSRAADALALDRQTVEDWKRQQVRSERVRRVFEPAIETIFGVPSDQLSLLYCLFYVHAAGGFMPLAEIRGGAQEARFKGGAQQLSLGLAEPLGDRVVLSAPVSRIAQDPAGVVVTSAQGPVRARRVVVAVPPQLAGQIAYEPGLPAARRELFERFPMGQTVKVIALYDRTFWRDRGYSGEVVATGGPFAVLFDNTSADGAQPALMGFVEGERARRWREQPEADGRKLLTDALGRYFGNEARTPTHLVVQDWCAEPWSQGCPVGAAKPGALTTGHARATQVGAIHWAGTETARIWCGYMEGALESGERAAAEVLARL